MLALEPLPRGVVCFSDWIAYGLVARLEAEGLGVPADVAVIGQDDLWVSSLPQVRLSSIHHPRRAVGQKATEMLLAILEGQAPESEIIPGALVVRRTCGGSPQTDDVGWWRKSRDTDY